VIPALIKANNAAWSSRVYGWARTVIRNASPLKVPVAVPLMVFVILKNKKTVLSHTHGLKVETVKRYVLCQKGAAA
jgi:hypothetical protein